MATYTSNYGWTKPSGSDNVDISVLNNNLDDQDSTIHDAFLNMAPPFSESSTYAVDDIVLYGTKLYKCHTAVVTPGSWTGSTNWQVYKLSEGGSGGGGTSDYSALNNKPQINGVTLSGNKTASDLELQGALTFDNVPTDGSNNPVKSDGIYDALASKPDKTATATGETLSLVPTSEGKALIHTVYGMSLQDGTPTPSAPVDIESAKADFRCVGKNLIPYPYAFNSQTISAVAFTVNDDGTVEANGTASADINFYIHYRGNVQESAPCIIKNGKYILTGCQSDSGLSTFRLGVGRTYNNNWQTLGEDFGTGCYVTLNGDDYSPDNVHLAILISIKKNAVLSNVVFKPMLRLADVTDSTYEPYTKHDTTTDLTLRAIEVTSSDNYNLVRDGKYYIADTLDYDEDNGFVVTRRIKETVIDGSQSVTTSSNGQTMTCHCYNSGECISHLSPNNRFKGVAGSVNFLAAADSLLSDGECVSRSNKSSAQNENSDYFKRSSMTSASDWETWLANNPITVYDILATPITESITTEQALALLGLKTYDESTTISSQAEPSCTIAVEYAKERLGALALTAYNTAKGNDLRITALEA